MVEEEHQPEVDVEPLAARLVERAPRLQRKTKEVEAQVKTARARIVELTEDLNRQYLKEREAQVTLAGLLAQPDRSADYIKQLQAIQQLPEVDYLQVSKYGLEVFTHELISVPFKDGKRRRFGRMQITLGFDAGVHVRCLNKDEVKDPAKRNDRYYAYEHPHVYAENQSPYPSDNVCWGNMSGPVREFLDAGEYDGAAALAVQFLMRVNEGHNGAYSVKSWKVYDEKAEKVEKPGERREPVLDQRGEVVGVRVHRDRAQAEQQFRWERVACNGAMTVREGRYGVCGQCNRRVLLNAQGVMRAHGERRRVAV